MCIHDMRQSWEEDAQRGVDEKRQNACAHTCEGVRKFAKVARSGSSGPAALRFICNSSSNLHQCTSLSEHCTSTHTWQVCTTSVAHSPFVRASKLWYRSMLSLEESVDMKLSIITATTTCMAMRMDTIAKVVKNIATEKSTCSPSASTPFCFVDMWVVIPVHESPAADGKSLFSAYYSATFVSGLHGRMNDLLRCRLG